MSYLIDGHNLIPHVPGLELSELDDENRLINRLQQFCRVRRTKVEVYFDNAPTTHAGSKSFGTVRAHFVRSNTTADDAIRRRLEKLGKRAKNITVVSSDRQVQAEARGKRAKVISSADFARMLQDAETESMQSGEMKLSESELDEWLRLFGAADDEN